MSNDQNPQWLQDISRIVGAFQANQTPASRAAGKCLFALDNLRHVGVSEDHVRRAAEVADQIGTKTLMSKTDAFEYVRDAIYHHYASGNEITEETFQDLLKKAGVKP